jgi:hypothetical protein
MQEQCGDLAMEKEVDAKRWPLSAGLFFEARATKAEFSSFMGRKSEGAGNFLDKIVRRARMLALSTSFAVRNRPNYLAPLPEGEFLYYCWHAVLQRFVLSTRIDG